ncbi:MAG: N-acetyltransferase [Myxococcales bacterium]|nr:N-acetyltransferase [Myxococcales bacterium]
MSELRVEIANSLSEIPADAWDALVGEHNPFIEHGFLSALERSGCVGYKAGWLPVHVTVYRDDALVAAMPLYLKDNSYGEYIFDWGWAEAAYSAGLDYYPKLVSAVPFTPVTGRRLLTAGGGLDDALVDALVAGALAVAEKTGASSAHWLFVTEQEHEALAARGLIARLTHQYHWTNDGYQSFDDYLAAFRSPARKNVRKERRKAETCGLDLVLKRGPELDDNDWNGLWRFYRDTTSRKWGQPYLNKRFFKELRERFAHRVVAALAYNARGEPVAGTLNFHKGQHLYGRYWGCVEEHDALHFELCYYRLIELCIDNGWTRFEAGAQGSHKIQRGLMPALTYSAHVIVDPGLSRGIRRFVEREALVLRAEMRGMARRGPFKRDEPDEDCAQ